MNEQSPDYSLYREQVRDAVMTQRLLIAKMVRRKIESIYGMPDVAADVERWIMEAQV